MSNNYGYLENIDLPANLDDCLSEFSPTSAGDNRENSSTSTWKRNGGLVSPNLSDAKVKRRRQGTDFTGESSTSRPPKKTYAELIKHKSVRESATVLINRANNRTKTVKSIQLDVQRTNDQIITSPLVAKLQELWKDMNGIEDEIQRIKQDIRNIPLDHKKGELPEDVAKQRLIEIEDRDLKKILQDLQDASKRLDQIKQEAEKEHETARQLEPMFLNNMDYSPEILREKLTADPSLEQQLKLTESCLNNRITEFEDDNGALIHLPESNEAALQSALVESLQNENQIQLYKIKELEADNGALIHLTQSKEAALQTALAKASMVETLQKENQELKKQIQFDQLSSRSLNIEGITANALRSKIHDLKKQLYDENNNQVENRDFQGLEEALTTGNEVPDYLKLTAIRIEKDRGEATGSIYFSALVLVCAAVKEMEDSDDVSDWEILKKWAATLKQAKNIGFQVGFADKLLNTKLLAYLGLQS